MTVTITVIIGYTEYGGKYPRHTRLIVPVDDTAPIWTLKRTVDEAVREWARCSGYDAFEWYIKTAHIGRSDFFSGKIPHAIN